MPFDSISDLLRAASLRAPGALAVEDGERTLSFDALERQANGLAHVLQARGVAPEVRVAVRLEPSLDAVVALLAVWKAGGAYVPVAASLPPARARLMLGDCRLVLDELPDFEP